MNAPSGRHWKLAAILSMIVVGVIITMMLIQPMVQVSPMNHEVAPLITKDNGNPVDLVNLPTLSTHSDPTQISSTSTQIQVTASGQGSAGTEPRFIKDVVHTVATTPDGKYYAIGTRFTSNSDNRTIQIFEWDDSTLSYIKLGELGETYQRGNALDLEFTDFDNNGVMELTVASSDGYVYIFEMNFTPTLSFTQVWKSLFVVKAFNIDIVDVDADGYDEMALAGWSKYAFIMGIDPLNYTSSDHWGSFHERWRSDLQKSQAMSITSGDFNQNGLTDILVGSRDGSITMFEDSQNHNVTDPNYQCNYKKGPVNGGGQPNGNDKDNVFDICYVPIWGDNSTLWQEITQLESFDIDQDGYSEIVIQSLGLNVFILDYDGTNFVMDKLTLTPTLWESSGAYPLDYFADRLISATNITFDDTALTEPMSWLDPNNVISPFTSGMTNMSLNHHSSFGANGASAVLDWGNYEELTGGGNSEPDLKIHLAVPFDGNISNIIFNIARNNTQFDLNSTISSIWKSDDNMTILVDIDQYLASKRWEYAQYLYIKTAVGTSLKVQYLEATRINLRLKDSRSVVFDTIQTSDGSIPALLISTSQGNLHTFTNNANRKIGEPRLVPIANSYEDQRFLTRSGGAWDIEPVVHRNVVPNWRDPVSIAVFENFGRIAQFFSGPNPSDSSISMLYVVSQFNQLYVMGSPTADLASITTLSNQYFATVNAHYSNDASIRAAVGNINNGPYAELIISTSDSIDIWNFDGSTYALEASMGLTSALPTSQGSIPLEIATGDFNGDAVSDLVVSNMTHFTMLWNNPASASYNFTIDNNYFSDIEFEISRQGYHEFTRELRNLQFMDTNNDGDLDLITSYHLRPGFTYFENTGNFSNPDWVEKRSMVHNRPVATTFTNYDYEFGLIWVDPITGLWQFLSVNDELEFTIWNSSFDYQQSYLMVTKYQVNVIQVNYNSNPDNWGFQYFEASANKIYYEPRSGVPVTCTCTRFQLQSEIRIKAGDSDGDSIMDGLEGFSRINSIKTDISDADTDGDGLSDLFELQHGLDPRDADSNGDLVSDGEKYFADNGIWYCDASSGNVGYLATTQPVATTDQNSQTSSSVPLVASGHQDLGKPMNEMVRDVLKSDGSLPDSIDVIDYNQHQIVVPSENSQEGEFVTRYILPVQNLHRIDLKPVASYTTELLIQLLVSSMLLWDTAVRKKHCALSNNYG